MHLKRVRLFPEVYPPVEKYPFNQPIFQHTASVEFCSPVTFFVGENGSGKTTLLEAVANRCDIPIWRNEEGRRFEVNPHEQMFYRFIRAEWCNGRVPGSFFGSDIFRHFTHALDEWAAADPENLDYFGGKSLVTQSHGQSTLSFFRARYQIKGLYLLDEPETALSPKNQWEFVKLIRQVSVAGHAQFIIATHSPILLACPGAQIYSFDQIPIQQMDYEDTAHYRFYHDFLTDMPRYLRTLA